MASQQTAAANFLQFPPLRQDIDRTNIQIDEDFQIWLLRYRIRVAAALSIIDGGQVPATGT